MAPITNPERYEGSVDFWCDVYGIDSKSYRTILSRVSICIVVVIRTWVVTSVCNMMISNFFSAVSALVPLAKKITSEEPSIETIGGENVISWPSVVSLGEVS